MLFTVFQDILTVIQVFGNLLTVSELHWERVYVNTLEVIIGDCNLTRQGRLQKTTTTTTTTCNCCLTNYIKQYEISSIFLKKLPVPQT